jgi:hypothetical protein
MIFSRNSHLFFERLFAEIELDMRSLNYASFEKYDPCKQKFRNLYSELAFSLGI